MEKCLISCFKCNKDLENFDKDGNHPLDGVEFSSRGHYGSSIWDPMDGSQLIINICDQCVKTGSEQNTVLRNISETVKKDTFKLFKIDR